MKKSVEVISLIFKSLDYLDLIVKELKSDKCKVDGWDVSIRIVANDATPEVIEKLKLSDIPYTIYNDPKPNDYYLNRVYRCWNHAGETSEADNICFVNSTALIETVPEPIKIANNSASERAALPFNMSFSRGRSSSAHDLMLSCIGISFDMKVNSFKLKIV